jgi:hypothetical protein
MDIQIFNYVAKSFTLLQKASILLFLMVSFGNYTQLQAQTAAELSADSVFTIIGINGSDESGFSVASGDINGDGIDDLIIGAPTADPNGFNSGQTYVVFGSTGGNTIPFNLSSLDGTNGFTINGINQYVNSGYSLASGDINGDGTDDVIIGAPGADPNGSDSGETYVVFGSDTLGSSGSFELSSLNGSNGFTINGITSSSESGSAVFGADINGDGADEVIIWAPYETSEGQCYVVFGGSNVGTSGTIELSSLSGINGFVLNNRFITRVAFASGDINNDGTNDLIIGSVNAGHTGKSYVIFGSSNLGASGTLALSSLNGTNGFALNGINLGDQSGGAVASGDINGDGTDDVIIGATNAAPNGTNSGQSYVVFGGSNVGTSGTVALSSLNGTNGFKLNGIRSLDISGFAVSSGDINGDGTDDVIIGAPRADPNDNDSNSGQSYVVFGGSNVGALGTIELSSLNGNNGFALNGFSTTAEIIGSAVATGDINGDGIDEMIIGAPEAIHNGLAKTGKTYGVSFSVLGLLPAPASDLVENALPLNSNLDISFTAETNLDFNFDAVIDGTTVTQSAFQVYGNQTGRYSGTISGRNTNTLTFDPDTNFKPGEHITVTLKSSIATSFDTSLTKNYTFSFIASSELINPEVASPNTISTTVSTPTAVFPADLDGDGDVDLSSTATPGNAIIWHRNNGSGSFARFTVANAGDGLSAPVDTRIADLDNDGDLDILSASEGNNSIHWFENDGSESFTTHTITSSADGLQSIFTADLDGDGDSDVLSASENDDIIAWYDNNGSEVFTKRIISSTVDGANHVLVADMDNDGDLDVIASAAAEDTLSWYENDGSSNFTPQIISSSTDGIHKISASDIDQDGDMDVVSVSPGSGRIIWHENDGNQSFTSHNITTSANGVSALKVIDYDGDGNVDVISTGINTNNLVLYHNGGNENFTSVTLSSTQQSIASLSAADIDGSDGLNIISSSTGDNQILWFGTNIVPQLERTGIFPVAGAQSVSKNATITASFSTPIDASTVSSTSFKVSSNKTGLLSGTLSVSDSVITFQPSNDFSAGDLITVTLTEAISDTISSIRKIQPQTFSFLVKSNPINRSENYAITEVRTSAGDLHYITSADIDGDGDMDVAAAGGSSNTITWHENDGAQSYTEHTVADNLDFATSVFAADLDSDGNMDLLSSSRNDNTITWHENDGSQTFTSSTIASDITSTEIVTVYDVNSDGNMDVLVASDTELLWYENDGSESFTKRVIASGLSDPRSLYATDMDTDGDIDIVAGIFSGHQILVFENNGSESFTARTVVSSFFGSAFVFATDMDGDGDQDILGAAFFSNGRLSWFENDGNLSFTERTIVTGFAGARSIRAGDVDGDGDMDVIGASQIDDAVILYINDGNQNFSPSTVTTSADNARLAEFTDMDGDGDLDILVASKNDSTIAWYEFVPIVSSSSLAFNGTDTYINADRVAPHLSGSSSFTFETWIKPDFAGQTDPNDVTILNIAPSGFRIFLGNNANKDQVIRVTGNATLIGPALTDRRWTHIAYTINSGTGTLYVDGASVGTHSTSVSFTDGDKWNIGATGSIGSLSDVFAGTMDEFKFWNIDQTADQIRRHMFQRISTNESDLVAYFPLDEFSGSTVFDRSPNTIRATLEGAPGWSDDTHPYGTFISGSEGWRILTAPAANVSFSTLLDTLWTQGFTGADVLNGTSNLYTWSEPSSTFNAVVNGNTTPAAGKAFITYVYDDQDNDGTADGFPKMIRIDSAQHSGNISPSLSYTNNGTPANDGWNLVGNPYGTSIDWDAPNGLSRNNLDASLYVWNHSAGGGNGAYQSWNGSAGTLSDGKLAPLQGFWVKANAANPSINFSALARSTGGVFRKEQAAQSVPQLTFTLADSSGSSQTLVMFHEQALIGKDPYDAYKLGSLNGESLALYSLLEDSSALEINALPLNFEEPLDIPVTYSGSSEIHFSLSWEHALLPEEWEFVLTDHIAEISVDLKTDSVYTFSQDSSKAKKIAKEVIPPSPPQLVPRPLKRKASTEKPRFTMRVSKTSAVSSEPENDLPTKVELRQNYPNPFNPSTTIAYGLPQTGKVTLEVFDILGRRVATLLNGENKTAGRHTVNFNASNLASGMYIYRLQAGNSVIIKKLTLIK